jgi:hypothetical protein
MEESEPEPGRQLTVTKPRRTVAAASVAMVVPAIIAAAGDQAARRFLEFFAADAAAPRHRGYAASESS